MAISLVSRYLLTFLVISTFFLSIALPHEPLGAKPPLSFSFERFEKNHSFDSEIALYGDAVVDDSMVRISSNGRIMYRKPIKFLGRNPGFSTYFSFSISPGEGGGLALLVIPSSVSLKSKDGHRFGLSPTVLAVGFVTSVESANHIEIDVGGEICIKTSNLSDANLVLNNGEKLHSWIDYDGDSTRLEVRLSQSRALRPMLISYPIDLSGVLSREAMLVGVVSSSTGNSTQTTSIYSWSFVVKHGAPYLMHSEPMDPSSFLVRTNESPPIHLMGSNHPWRIITALAFAAAAAACGALVVFIVFFLRSAFVRRHPVAPVEYPVHHPVEIVYEKIVLVGDKIAAAKQ